MAYKQGSVKEKPWLARVTIDGQRVFLGYFATKQAADDAEAAFRLQNHRPPEPRKAQRAGLALGKGHLDRKSRPPIYGVHPCFECPLAECDDSSKLCALRVMFNKGQNAMRHKRPLSDLDRRKYNIARSELAQISKENRADG